jgi:hypothetical protein
MHRTATALALLTVIAAACANEPGGSGDGGVDHPTGADEVVLRLSYEGGFVPVEYTLTQFPAFTLYGDGRIVVPGPQIEIYPGPALPAMNQRIVTEDGMQAIIRAALDAGLGKGDRDVSDFGSTVIADASTAVFTFSANGRTSRVSVYALAELPEKPEGMPDEEFEARAALNDLAQRLGSLEQWLPEGSVGPDGPFHADRYRIFVGPYRPAEELPQDPVAWPLATPLSPGDGDTAGYACRAVRGEDRAVLAPLAREANQLTPWVSAGEKYSVLFRPLLPDESGC